MKKIFSVFIRHRSLISFGILAAAFSSVGQTYLVSLFIPSIQEMLNYTKSEISLLYGGSVNAENVLSITDQDNIDGVLVGGASVSMETFGKLIERLASRRQ